MAHTPGPWVGFGDGGKTIAILPAGRDGDICNFSRPFPKRDDARLIAAAPDMLAELRRLFVKHGEQTTNDVIAKAEGR